MLVGGLWKVGQPACDSSPVRHLIMPVNSTRRGAKAVPEGESDSPQPPVSVCPLQVRKRDFAIKQIRDAAIDLFVEKGALRRNPTSIGCGARFEEACVSLRA